MIKYSNLLSFNIIVHNKYHRGNQGYRVALSKRPLKGKKYSGPPLKAKA